MLAASARADTVADMRSAISQLRATKPIHASIEVQRSRKNEGRFANQQFTGAASLDAVEDEAGQRVNVPHHISVRAVPGALEHTSKHSEPILSLPGHNTICPCGLVHY